MKGTSRWRRIMVRGGYRLEETPRACWFATTMANGYSARRMAELELFRSQLASAAGRLPSRGWKPYPPTDSSARKASELGNGRLPVYQLYRLYPFYPLYRLHPLHLLRANLKQSELCHLYDSAICVTKCWRLLHSTKFEQITSIVSNCAEF